MGGAFAAYSRIDGGCMGIYMVIGLALSIALLGYLGYALARPERF
jgi:K+-transporting ATPase KdpF subunit